MAARLADAIAARKKLLIVADYDADGATACAVGMRALRAFGADVDYLVPNRFEYGYGLSPEIVRLAHAQSRPDILITVDNGIASIEGVAEANRLGMQVLITDHHLPGERLPDAACIINPNQPGCAFPSKNLAGVGVMFYLMLALRAELRERGAFGPSRKSKAKVERKSTHSSAHPLIRSSLESGEPNLAELLAARRAGHRRRRRAAGPQQPHPGAAGSRPHPRGPHAAGNRGAVQGRGSRSARAPRRATWVSCWARG